MCSQGISQFYLHTRTFIRSRNEPYLPSPSKPQLVLICRPRRDGRLSIPWCEVAQTEIRTCNLIPIANPPHSTKQPLAHPVKTPNTRDLRPSIMLTMTVMCEEHGADDVHAADGGGDQGIPGCHLLSVQL